jgi:hypothetical protein
LLDCLPLASLRHLAILGNICENALVVDCEIQVFSKGLSKRLCWFQNLIVKEKDEGGETDWLTLLDVVIDGKTVRRHLHERSQTMPVILRL